jgi:5-hydroxyisourate hydrolase
LELEPKTRSAGGLTTAVIDAEAGMPAAGMLIDLFRVARDIGERQHVRTVETNAQGAVDEPLLAGAALEPATYELLFHVGRYFKARRVPLDEDPFLNVVPVRFSIADLQHSYHVTLLAGPWSYTVYRG